MGKVKTAEETREEYIHYMGSDLGELMAFFRQELAHLYFMWNDYVLMYGKNPKYLKTLNECCPSFFWSYQRMFREYIIIALFRLIDPKPKNQISLVLLKGLIANEVCKEKISLLLEDLSTLSNDLIQARHNYYAHYNQKLKLKNSGKAINGTSKNSIEKVLKVIGDILNTVTSHYMNGTTTPYEIIDNGYGALGLIIRLKQSQLYDKLEYQQKLHGKIDPELLDFNKQF